MPICPWRCAAAGGLRNRLTFLTWRTGATLVCPGHACPWQGCSGRRQGCRAFIARPANSIVAPPAARRTSTARSDAAALMGVRRRVMQLRGTGVGAASARPIAGVSRPLAQHEDGRLSALSLRRLPPAPRPRHAPATAGQRWPRLPRAEASGENQCPQYELGCLYYRGGGWRSAHWAMEIAVAPRSGHRGCPRIHGASCPAGKPS